MSLHWTVSSPTNAAATLSRASANFVAWAPAAIGLLVFACTIFTPAVLADGDTWWHLAAGDWILAHGAPPRVDPFSYTFAGAPWVAHEWLAELFFALSYRLAGWSGVLLLAGAASGGAAMIVARRVARDLDGPSLIVVMLMGLSLIAGSLLARPHLLALPVIALWTSGLLAARDRDQAPSLLLLPLMVLWVNLHGSFMFGLALLGPFALDALLAAAPEKSIAVLRDWLAFGLLAALAACLNPHGVEAFSFPFKLMALQSLATVTEWRPENFAQTGPLELALLALVAFALTRPIRVAPARLMLLVGLIHMALHHGRHEMLLGLIAPMLLAAPIARAIGLDSAPPDVSSPNRALRHSAFPNRPCPNRPWSSRALGCGFALLVLLIGARLALPAQNGEGVSAPVAALAAVPAELRDKPMLNAYHFGGYLIWNKVRPFIDGRTDMYGDDFNARFDQISAADPKALDQAIRQYDIAWSLFPPADPIVAALDRKPGWRRLFANEFAVVQVRDEAARDDAIGQVPLRP